MEAERVQCSCGTMQTRDARYCHECGIQNKIKCKSCKFMCELVFKYCPSCGTATCGVANPAASPAPVADFEKEGSLSLQEVKEKLNAIRGRRLESPAYSKKMKTSAFKDPKSGKSSYVLICGIKEYRKERQWVQMRGKSSCYGAVKLEFRRESTYQEVLEKLRNEFQRSEREELHLIDMENNIITKTNEFTIYKYIQLHKKYVGSTRIYLGIKCMQSPLQGFSPVPTPTSITIQEDSSVSMTTPTTNLTLHGDASVSMPTPTKLLPGDTAVLNQTNKNICEEIIHTDQTAPETGSSVPNHDDLFNSATDCVIQEIAETMFRHEDVCDLPTIDTSQFVPVYARNPKLMVFQEHKGMEYAKIQSNMGTFLCIPHSDMSEFDEFAKSFDGDNLFIADSALMYFLHYVVKDRSGGVVQVETYTDEVFKLSDELSDLFKNWKTSVLKDNS